jgi:hypothetical protein
MDRSGAPKTTASTPPISAIMALEAMPSLEGFTIEGQRQQIKAGSTFAIHRLTSAQILGGLSVELAIIIPSRKIPLHSQTPTKSRSGKLGIQIAIIAI